MKIFDYCKSVRPQALECTQSAFEEVIKSEQVLRTCNQIRQLVESSDAKEKIQALKAQLPGFCFHAHFTDGMRSVKSAEASGLLSLDLDHIDDPKSFYDGLAEEAKKHRMALAFITPSTHGLKLVMEVPESAQTLEEAQEMLVKALGVDAYFDTVAHDLARLAFAVPESYILYRDDTILFGEHKLKAGFGTEQQLDAKLSTQSKEGFSNEPVPENEGEKHFVDGIMLKEVVEAVAVKLCGKAEPTENRNNTLYQATKLMRVPCDDSKDLIEKVMPLWGQEPREWRGTIASAMSRPISATTRKEFEQIMHDLKRKKAIERGDNTWTLPQLPKVLPPLFKEFAHVTPPELQPAQMASLLTVGGFYGTMMKANYSDPDEQEEWHTPGFLAVATGNFAGGKKSVTNTYNMLTERQRKREEPLYEQINRYNRNKTKEQLPEVGIRLMPEKLSVTSLSVHMENAKGKSLFLFTPEIDTLKNNNGSAAWNDLSTVFRKAFDNDRFGQMYLSGESHCTNVPVYLNMLIEAQPESMESFFNEKNVMNGLVSRCFFVDMPDTLGQRKAKIKKFSGFELRNINLCLDRLEQMGQVVEEAQYDEEGNLVKDEVKERQIIQIPRVRKAMKEFQRKHQDNYVLRQDNPAEDIFSRRAAIMGFRAGMIAYVTSGMRETKAVVDLAVFVAEYALQSILLHFGDVFNQHYLKTQKKHTDKVIAINKVANFNLFEAVGDDFTIEDIQNARSAQGLAPFHNPWKIPRQWIAHGLVELACKKGKVNIWHKIKKNHVDTESKVA